MSLDVNRFEYFVLVVYFCFFFKKILSEMSEPLKNLWKWICFKKKLTMDQVAQQIYCL